MVAMDPAFDYDWMASTKKIASGDGIKSPAELPAGYYPMLVMFGDIADPKSVEQVEREAIGVNRISVEVTDEAVTTGILNRLEWLQSHKGSLDYTGRLHPDNPEKDLTSKAFKQEQKQ